MTNRSSEHMGTLKFFKESVKNLKTVGTITRSSKYLCKGMIKPVNFDTARVIVELGAGDGVVTRHILRKMHKDAILLAFELNPKFCTQIREINDPRLVVVEDDAEKIASYLQQYGHEKADAIISALPFTLIPEDVCYRIIEQCKLCLIEKGPYIQIHYSLFPRKMYLKIFGNLELNFVPLNVPPAWVMVSEKRS